MMDRGCASVAHASERDRAPVSAPLTQFGKRADIPPSQVQPSSRTRCPQSVLTLVVVLVASWLTACKSLPPPAPAATEPWEVRRAALQQRDRFDLSGRIAVAAAQEGFNAKLRWNQQGARSSLALDGPLGVGGVRITADGDALNVINARGEQLDSEAARREIAARLGFEPPLQSLRYWVQGVPDPAHPADEVLDENKRLATLRQDGWQIDYSNYAAADGQWLPSRMTLKRDDVRVRLLVDGWGS
jgi:outer membrane lipoprotein LolB